MNSKRVLIACEFSQVITNEFRKRGFEAFSCDILPGEINPDWHIQDDVLKHLDEKWDLMIAHPPCTFLCNSGVSHLHKDDKRWDELRKGSDFFKVLLNADIPRIAIENPIPHKYSLLPPYTQKIQPYDFGHGESKATCLWLENLPRLEKTTNVYDWKNFKHKIENGREQGVHKFAGNGGLHALDRSRTYPGIAKAIAEQWGNVLLNEVVV